MNHTPAEATRIGSTGSAVTIENRAALISKSLKAAARQARTPRNVWAPVRIDAAQRWRHIFALAVTIGFALVVLVPNIVASLYLAFVASDQYATETRFAVRGGEVSLLDQFGGLIGIPSAQRVQDALILSDYIRGRSMVEAVDSTLNLRQVFARDHVDFLSRFDPNESDEKLTDYWKNHVQVSIDSMSGIITVIVRAFTPQDSLNITKAITALSEKMVNDLSKRSRQDTMRQAKFELSRASENLKEKSIAIRDVRNDEGILDSAVSSETMIKLMSKLRLELVHLQQEYSTLRQTVSENAPQVRVLQARLNSMKDQIGQLENKMTGPRGAASGSLSASMGRFDRAKLERDIAERQYVAAATAFERARMELETQGIYLATFLKPILAQEALYPKRIWLWSIVAFVSLLIWASGVGLAVFVRNHIAT